MNEHRLNRRRFLGAASIAGISAVTGAAAEEKKDEVSAAKLPRWRGFNLLEKFIAEHSGPFFETDFEWMAEWGFHFARLPLSYHCWSDPKDWKSLREPVLKEIDQVVEWGRRHRVHINLNFHRAPGYCVNPPTEPFDLWKDDKALEACAYHWGHFAQRYKGIPNTRLSFDLLNEPANVSEESYVRVIRRLEEAIREQDADRLIIADGLQYGTKPVHGLADLKIAQSTRGYEPFQFTHYRASWAKGSDRWPEPTWPYKDPGGQVWDKQQLRKKRIEPWKALERKGVGIHVGEWGAYQYTPHKAVLAWMRDSLELWKEAGWGWALWNFRGSFGILDSGRKDVKHESYHGHKLDRAMLDVLRAG